MNTGIETLAFLHSHGLDVEPKGMSAHLRAAIKAIPSLYFPEPGQEGLTTKEADVARSGGLDPRPTSGKHTDPLLLGVVAYASLIQTGLTAVQAAKRLGVSDARIRQRIQGRTLLALREGGSWSLPVFQFTERGELPGWGAVVSKIPLDVSPVSVEQWLLLPHADLVPGKDETPMSPRAWLLEGRPPQAVAALAGELA